ncbi:NmrA family NAD(P)-binding protein [Mucilaginibacter celer]|uniref:NAD-dependent epimerase/dehydratase family protein n=1 Tax=Mucilaginibacter celer TaxID=2305508 RepID=A0A494VK83_9SPHI|nr:NmrA family NAD(P)-binding protein [Mucilaginibacter celer]AYL94339.1 NAD-dependent epimerase/dehydratase family protein [Mucilaginibacter celer]
MDKKILVTGATGKTGKETVYQLLKNNIPVRALVRKADERSAELKEIGAEIVLGDLLDFDSVTAALKGITGAYFVYPVIVPGILDATAKFAQAALENGLEMVVNMSQISARREAKSNAAQSHWLGERLFDRSGVPVVHLRPTFFAEWLMYRAGEIKVKNSLTLPFGNGVYAPIAAADQGRFIAAILAGPEGHAGKTYPLFGPKELSQFEIADILTEVLKRKITYYPVEIADYGKFMEKEFGYDPWFVQHVIAVAQDCRDGIFSGTNELIRQITGTAPMSMHEYIEENRGLFE